MANSPGNILISNVSLFSDVNAAGSHDIFIEGGIISAIMPSGGKEYEGDRIDGSGLTAIPGLIDLHIHGAGGSDSLDGTTEALSTISKTLAKLGTTAFLSTMVVRPGQKNHYLAEAAECTGKDIGGAHLLGVYIEGPFINIAKRGGIVTESITEPSPSILEAILKEAGSALKIMCIAPEIPGSVGIIKMLKDRGIIAAFGHSDADFEETKRGFEYGISHVTHLFNAMRPLHHRDPGPLAAIFDNPQITLELIGDAHHVHPCLIRIVRKLAGADRIACITDGISGMGLPDGTYYYNKKKYISRDGLAKYMDGTFIGSTMSLARIVRNYMTYSGSGLREAIETVTINPARILGIDNRKGSIEKGKDADIVLIDGSFNVHYTIISGKTVYTKNI